MVIIYMLNEPFLIAKKVKIFWTSERSLKDLLKNKFVELTVYWADFSFSKTQLYVLKHSRHKIYVQFVFLQGPR